MTITCECKFSTLTGNERLPTTPGRYRPKRSQTFLNTFEYAQKGSFLLKKEPSQSQQDPQSFQIEDLHAEKEYTVKVSKAPSCTCQHTISSPRSRELCKHLIWVYLNVLRVEETSDLLHQIILPKENVTEVLSTKDAKSILSQDERNGRELQWYLLHKEETDLGKNPGCTARRCKKKIWPGALCLRVKGLQVVNNQRPVEESLFYFCPSRDCIKQFPLNSNLKFPTKIFIGKSSLRSAEIFVGDRDGYPQLTPDYNAANT